MVARQQPLVPATSYLSPRAYGTTILSPRQTMSPRNPQRWGSVYPTIRKSPIAIQADDHLAGSTEGLFVSIRRPQICREPTTVSQLRAHALKTERPDDATVAHRCIPPLLVSQFHAVSIPLLSRKIYYVVKPCTVCL